MPCWYFERKEIKNSPSFQDGIDAATESRYRREGARFILDAGIAMSLRHDTCATGVIYFHRFYMFHSLKEFYRYVTAACCLFLAGKVEETPKKCKDIIKIAQKLLSPRSFIRFGEDPREEVITMERILLKTIKFDLQVEHPYSFMLKYAKYFKDKDKEKTQKMAQMAWTFINDSLCTTLCLQWEAEIVAVSLMYLASRLTKFEPSDWTGRNSSKSKWWEDIIEGMSMELMEDICHQVLDLYSPKGKKTAEIDSPPSSPFKYIKSQTSPPPPPDKPPGGKRSKEGTPSEPEPPVKVSNMEKDQVKTKAASTPKAGPPTSTAVPPGAPIPVAQHMTPTFSSKACYSSMDPTPSSAADTYSSYNPYVSSQMYGASFMSQEGSQNIQSILAGSSTHPPTQTQQYSESHHHNPPSHLPSTDTPPQYPPPPSAPTPYSYLPPPPDQYTPPNNIPLPHSYPPPPTNAPPPGYDPYSMPPNSSSSYPPVTYAPPPLPPPSSTQHSYPPPSIPRPHQPYGNYNFPPAPSHHGTPTHVMPPHLPLHQPSNYRSPSPYSNQLPPQGPNSRPNFAGGSHHFPKHGAVGGPRKDIPALTEIKIAGRPEWNLP